MRIERLEGDVESGLRTQAGEPVPLAAQVYSAVMDIETCDACAMWDGAEGPFDPSGDRYAARAPNHLCTNPNGCRCVWLYVSDRESIPLVPAAKALPLFGTV